MAGRDGFKVFEKTITATALNNLTNLTNEIPEVIRSTVHIRPPFELVMKTSNAGASAPDTGLSFIAQWQWAPVTSGPFQDQSGLVTTAITAAGDQAQKDDLATGIGPVGRCHVDWTATNGNDGSLVEVWLYGDRV